MGRLVRVGHSDPEEMYRIEQLKKLGTIVFKGSTYLVDAKA